MAEPRLTCISAVTLAVSDMARAVAFYTDLGFEVRSGGPEAGFTTLEVGDDALNLTTGEGAPPPAWWGRVIFHVSDVDAWHARAVERGLVPRGAPRDAPWGERYFHIVDADGHELSFAAPLAGGEGVE